MARAKQTARAEARRRARIANRPLDAETDAIEGEVIDDDESLGAGSATAGRSQAGARGRTEIRPRPGLRSVFGSFGQAYRRANVREDLAVLPKLLLTRGFLAALGMVLLGFILAEAFPGYSGSSFAFQFLTFPPALAPIFVAGFFAPRASYLLGLLVGLFDALVYAVWLVTVLPTLGAATAPTDVGLYVVTALFWSAVTGIVFGAGAAWYRRFLQLTSPKGQARGQQRGGRNQPARGKSTPATANSGRRRY